MAVARCFLCDVFYSSHEVWLPFFFILLIRNIIDKIVKCSRQAHSQTMNTVGCIQICSGCSAPPCACLAMDLILGHQTY